LPENVTFPAITICNPYGYTRERYRYGWFLPVNTENINIRNESKIKGFLDLKNTYFFNHQNKSYLSVMNHLDYFKLHDKNDSYDCFRFNAVTNKSVELFKASSPYDSYNAVFNLNYREQINSNEYFSYSFLLGYSLVIFVGDNHLRSIEKLEPMVLTHSFSHSLEIARESIETKLPEPYNQCKDSISFKNYYQSDCIQTCVFKEIKDKYNCTYALSLFAIQGLKQCSFYNYTNEFYLGCLKECPLDSCFSEKFTHSKYFSVLI
jgi:hypothetical protein